MYLPLWIIIPPWKRFKKTGLSFPWTTLTYRKKWEITTPSIKSDFILPQGPTNNQGLNPLSVNSFHWLAVWWCLGGCRPQGCHGYQLHLTAVLGSTSFSGTFPMLIYCYSEFNLRQFDHTSRHFFFGGQLMHSHGLSIWSSNFIVMRIGCLSQLGLKR